MQYVMDMKMWGKSKRIPYEMYYRTVVRNPNDDTICGGHSVKIRMVDTLWGHGHFLCSIGYLVEDKEYVLKKMRTCRCTCISR